MKPAVPPLPSYPLSPLARAGVLVRPLANIAGAATHPSSAPHRDAHYLLVLLTAGELHLTLDFEDLTLCAPALLLISPGQVHRLRETRVPQGWGVSFEPSLVSEEVRALLTQGLQRPLLLGAQHALQARAETLLALLADCQQESVPTAHLGSALQALLAALLHLVAGELAPPASGSGTTRGRELLAGFHQLLSQHFTTWKQPAQYAAALAVTPSHLNDTVKALSGYPVSQHLQARTILEAKRLLYHTDQSVKQIGYALGYEEPVYFGKLFKKATGLTPQQFRHTIRE